MLGGKSLSSCDGPISAGEVSGWSLDTLPLIGDLLNRVATSAQLFLDGASCSQAVFAAFAPSMGIESAEALRLAAGLGGGMRIGGTCGAATGAVLVLGLRFGGENDVESRSKVTAAVEEFLGTFVERVGAADCPAILGCDFRSEEGKAIVREQGLRESRCLPAVRAAAQILEEMLGHSGPMLRTLGPGDAGLLGKLMDVFADAFEDKQTYTSARPDEAYAEGLLGSDAFIALVALDGGCVVGGLTAYELVKPESERSEIYIYDLAVSASHRRRGIASGLIEQLRRIAGERGAWVSFVQADQGDDAAIALYSKFGTREDVVHFDISPGDSAK